MKQSLGRFLDILEANRRGRLAGVTSLCTAHPVVLRAAMRQAVEDGSLVLIESTSNQVDQLGGYTGMTPRDFAAFAATLAAEAGLDPEQLLLGGDHLGPNRWRARPAAEAMEKARALVAAYAAAGFCKLHLDASMACADDDANPGAPLDDAIVAGRAADLCAAAEASVTGEPPLYVIGTEVPPPGGAQAGDRAPRVTSAADVGRTVETTRAAFVDRGLTDAWERVVAVVVQPGVEFGDDHVLDYRREAAASLSSAVLAFPRLVYEAHSTDYQTRGALRAMVEDHFCILKVGPWLTFALREALFALEAIEREVLARDHGLSAAAPSALRAALDAAMLARPEHWSPYYAGDPGEQSLKRAFGFSDRSRYYWPAPEVQSAVARLESNLRSTRLPLSLLSQHMARQYELVREGRIAADPRSLAESHVREVLEIYAHACGA